MKIKRVFRTDKTNETGRHLCATESQTERLLKTCVNFHKVMGKEL